MDTPTHHPRPETPTSASRLDEATCWVLLRTVAVGRLGVAFSSEPDIFPVNYVCDHASIIFRTGEGTKLTAALGAGTVAFESDGFDPVTGEAWSVVMKGSAGPIHDMDDLIAASLLPLAPWEGSPKHQFVRIRPDQITGRRFAVVDAALWHNPYTLRRNAAFE